MKTLPVRGTDQGPLERRTIPAGGPWSVIAEQHRKPSGEVLWDVFAEYPSGARVPAGENLFRDPQREVDRLVNRVIAWSGDAR